MIKNGVLFNFYENNLIEMRNLTPFRINVVIPKRFSNGQVVDKIVTYGNIEGRFGKITIADEIETVEVGAFSYCNAKEIVWPAKCLTIPDTCFFMSAIDSVKNVDNVTLVGEGVFRNAKIKEFSWPSGCETIPVGCFFQSSLETLKNIDHVTSIGALAFYEAVNLKLDLSKTQLLGISARAFTRVPKENITFPYYMDKDTSEVFE